MPVLFNDLLADVGVARDQVRLLRHHTSPGKGGMSLYDLWKADCAGFELYQREQKVGRQELRSGRYWASFASPSPGSTLFLGLYEARFLDTIRPNWDCPYRGMRVNSGEPVDFYEVTLSDTLSEHIGRLRVEWPPENVRTWIRYAENAPFPVVETSLARPLSAQERALLALGFTLQHATQKVSRYHRGNLIIYRKRETERLPLIVHPRFLDIATSIAALPGVETEQPPHPYVNSNLTEFPLFEAEYRGTTSHIGFALDATAEALPKLIALLDKRSSLQTSEGTVRLFGTTDDPLTEQERLQTARIGQGTFRQALLSFWKGRCAIAGIDQWELLRASHIKPWRSATNQERLDPFNGLLLAVHIDTLFDKGMISFADNGAVLVSSALSADNSGRLGIRPETRLEGLVPQHLPYLAYHRARVFRA